MKFIVDRIEESIAVLEKEDLSHINVPLSSLPNGTKEGSVLEFDGTTYTVNKDEEEKRRSENFNLLQNLLNKNKKG